MKQIDLKQKDLKFPYVDMINDTLTDTDIQEIEQQNNLKLLSIKQISQTKTRYGFKKVNEE